MKSVIFVLMCAVISGQGLAETNVGDPRGTWDLNLDFYLESDDNINRGADGTVQLDDTAVGLGVVAERDQPFAYDQALVYSIGLEHKSFNDWDGLSHSAATLGLEYRVRTRRRFVAPVYSFYTRLRSVDYDNHLRDGAEWRLGFSVNKPLTDRTSFVLGMENYRRDAESEIFELSYNRLFVSFDWLIGQATSLYLQYQYLDGDIVSSVPSGSYDPGSSVPYVLDDAIYFVESIVTQTGVDPYGNPVNSYTNNIIPAYAYKVDAETDVLELGLNLSLTKDQAFQFSVSNYESQTQYDFDYSGSLLRLDYLLRF